MTSVLTVEALALQRFATVLVRRMIDEMIDDRLQDPAVRRPVPLGWRDVDNPEQWRGTDRDEKAERLYAVALKLRSLVYGRVDNPALQSEIDAALADPATRVATRTRWAHLAQLLVLAHGTGLKGAELALDRYFRRADVVETWRLLEDDAEKVKLDIPAIVSGELREAEPDLSERLRAIVVPHHQMAGFLNLPEASRVKKMQTEWKQVDAAIAKSCGAPWERVDEVTMRIARELRDMDLVLSRSQLDTIVYFLTYEATGALGRQSFFRDFENYSNILSGGSFRAGMRKYREKWLVPLLPDGSLDPLRDELDAYERALTDVPPAEAPTP
ncbi:MAG: hypothetical protein ACKORC_08635 [Acidimicrobiia bacterium]